MTLKHKGGDGNYTLVGRAEDSDTLKIGYFKVVPTKLSFDKNMHQKIAVEFAPEMKGTFK